MHIQVVKSPFGPISFLYLLLSWLVLLPCGSWGAEPKVQIQHPKDASRIVQEQSTILVSGKVSTQEARAANVDLFFVLDVSGSTAHYAGVDFGDLDQSVLSGRGRPQVDIFGGSLGIGGPPGRDLRNSILAAEIAGTRRLLSQLDPQTTRVGLITFSADAKLLHPLTHDFDRMKSVLDEVLMRGPYGGTHGRRDTSSNPGTHGARSKPAARRCS
jgi:hypothetical protein